MQWVKDLGLSLLCLESLLWLKFNPWPGNLAKQKKNKPKQKQKQKANKTKTPH